MCDTMVALGNSTKDGTVIFAKNSDRQANEPHVLIRVPRQSHESGARVQCTYISIDQVKETYDVLLLKPSWMWGAEMGCNEFGLNIGNEAVFTKVKQGPPALLGMDMVRLALERCQTSEQALYLIIDLLEDHGQGGNCGYEKRFVYHNSFLIADRSSAWVLETAGPYWAAEQVRDVRAISNRLSIGRKFDLAHPDLVTHAIEQKWCRSEEDFDFARCYSDRLYTTASGSAQRWDACTTGLQQAKGQITVETMLGILRTHHPKHKHPFNQSSLKSVCMHGGFVVGDHTTGSYVASLSEKLDTYWITGSSTPCISIFKPYWMIDDQIVFGPHQEKEALDFWLQRERLHRLILENKVPKLDDYLQEASQLEHEMLQRVERLDSPSPETLGEIMKEAWQQEQSLVESWVKKNQHNSGAIKGNLIFKRYWSKQTAKLGF